MTHSGRGRSKSTYLCNACHSPNQRQSPTMPREPVETLVRMTEQDCKTAGEENYTALSCLPYCLWLADVVSRKNESSLLSPSAAVKSGPLFPSSTEMLSLLLIIKDTSRSSQSHSSSEPLPSFKSEREKQEGEGDPFHTLLRARQIGLRDVGRATSEGIHMGLGLDGLP